jgi:hypothetical protein
MQQPRLKTREPLKPAAIAILSVGALLAILLGVALLPSLVKFNTRNPEEMLKQIRPGEGYDQIERDFGAPNSIEEHGYAQFDIVDYDSIRGTVKVFVSREGIVQFAGKYPYDGSDRKSFPQLH